MKEKCEFLTTDCSSYSKTNEGNNACSSSKRIQDMNTIYAKENIDPENTTDLKEDSKRERKVMEWLENIDVSSETPPYIFENTISLNQATSDEQSLKEYHELKLLNTNCLRPEFGSKKIQNLIKTQEPEIITEDLSISINQPLETTTENKQNIVVLQNVILSNETLQKSIEDVSQFVCSTPNQDENISMSSDTLVANVSSLSKVTFANCAVSKIDDFDQLESELSDCDDSVKDPNYAPNSSEVSGNFGNVDYNIS